MYRYDNYTDSFVRIDGEPNEPKFSKILEAYSKGFKDGADAVKGIKDEPYIDIETGILHWCGWKYRRIYEDEPQFAKDINVRSKEDE